MRLPVTLLLASFLMVPGCLDEGTGDAGGEGDDSLGAAGDATVPQPLVFSGSLKGIGPPASPPVATDPCPLQAQQCAQHAVTVPAGTWNVTFTLVGTDGMVTGTGVPGGTDYDLFVEGVGQSINPSGEADSVSGRLAAGTYTAEVLAWHDIDGSYDLTVTFAR